MEIIPNEEGNPFTPSYVSFTETEWLIGDAAMRKAARDPSNTVFNIKRLLGHKFSDAEVQASVAHVPYEIFGKDDKEVHERWTHGRRLGLGRLTDRHGRAGRSEAA